MIRELGGTVAYKTKGLFSYEKSSFELSPHVGHEAHEHQDTPMCDTWKAILQEVHTLLAQGNPRSEAALGQLVKQLDEREQVGIDLSTSVSAKLNEMLDDAKAEDISKIVSALARKIKDTVAEILLDSKLASTYLHFLHNPITTDAARTLIFFPNERTPYIALAIQFYHHEKQKVPYNKIGYLSPESLKEACLHTLDEYYCAVFTALFKKIEARQSQQTPGRSTFIDAFLSKRQADRNMAEIITMAAGQLEAKSVKRELAQSMTDIFEVVVREIGLDLLVDRNHSVASAITQRQLSAFDANTFHYAAICSMVNAVTRSTEPHYPIIPLKETVASDN